MDTEALVPDGTHQQDYRPGGLERREGWRMPEIGRYANGQVAQLIQKVIDSGVSQREMERRAKKSGFDITHSYISKLHRGISANEPDGRLQQALAAALGIPESVVRRAVIRDFWGYDPAEMFGSSAQRFEDDRVDVLMDALGRKLMRLPADERRTLVSEIMSRYVINGS